MMNALSALLEARDTDLGRFRAYRLEAGPDLLGDRLVTVTYGRIGTPGRSVRYSGAGEAAAKKLVHRSRPAEQPPAMDGQRLKPKPPKPSPGRTPNPE
jgi:hypothetical protein